jgi:hypothetical protein
MAKRTAPDLRSNVGIDIAHASRPGGVPTHVTSAPAAAPGAGEAARLAVYAKPATVDPFGWVGRARKTLGQRLSR